MEQETINDEIGKRLCEQVFSFWINPEIERRTKENRLPHGFKLLMAQIVMNVGQAPIVRLNGEIKATMVVRVTRDVTPDDNVYLSDFDAIEKISLTDSDPNAAHITMMLHKRRWVISFSFHYNSEKVKAHLEAAHEFLLVAHDCLLNKRFRSFYENLFAAVELTSKSWLLRMPLPTVLKSKNHKHIGNHINNHTRLGNVCENFSKLLNHLTDSRGTARYLDGEFRANEKTCEAMWKTAEQMHEFVRAPGIVNHVSHKGQKPNAGDLVPAQI